MTVVLKQETGVQIMDQNRRPTVDFKQINHQQQSMFFSQIVIIQNKKENENPTQHSELSPEQISLHHQESDLKIFRIAEFSQSQSRFPLSAQSNYLNRLS